MPAHKIFLFGIDRAGKTSLFKAIKQEKIGETKPTLAFNIGNIILDELEMQFWDAPGQKNFRKLWAHGLNKAKLLLFVLDTSDKERFQESKQEFDSVIKNPETRGVPLIVCFNKMDLQEAKDNLIDAKEIFKVPLITERKVAVFNTSALKAEGLNELKNKIIEIVMEMRFNA